MIKCLGFDAALRLARAFRCKGTRCKEQSHALTVGGAQLLRRALLCCCHGNDGNQSQT